MEGICLFIGGHVDGEKRVVVSPRCGMPHTLTLYVSEGPLATYPEEIKFGEERTEDYVREVMYGQCVYVLKGMNGSDVIKTLIANYKPQKSEKEDD